MLVNGLRIPRVAVAAVVGILAGAVFVVALGAGATVLGALAAVDELSARRVVAITGLLLSLAAFLIPLIAVRAELIDPRALRGYGLRRPSVGAGLLLLTLVGPGAVLIPVAFAPLLTWSGAGRPIAWIAAVLLVVQGVLSARLGTALGAGLRHHPVASALVRIGALAALAGGVVTLVAHLAPWLGSLAPGSTWSTWLAFVLVLAPLRAPAVSEAVGAVPAAALWRAPLGAESGDLGAALAELGAGILLILVLAVLWGFAVNAGFRATARISRIRAARVPGWFRRLPAGQTGAIAARSFISWRRDPRYRVVLVTLPIVAGGILAAMWMAAVPLPVAALAPLPVILLLVSWASLHNDVAMDSSAVWLHLAAQTRGVSDRLGRLLPVLVLGGIIAVVGVPLTVWAYGDLRITPAVAGVAIAVLLGGAGISSLFAVRFPYPTTRPGDPPFQQPQVPGSAGGAIQIASVLLIVIVASPALAASGLWLAGVPGPWNWVALACGAATGVAMLAVGVRVGGALFDRRAPDLLAFTMRN
jgi:ABC-2 type transport system permease protein